MKTIRFTSDELNKRVRRVIMNARPTIDNRITKEEIAHKVYGRYTPSIDRSIRDAVNELRKQGHPIISSAGQAGYWYDPQAIDTLIADYQSRIADMSETVRALKQGRHETVRQLELIG